MILKKAGSLWLILFIPWTTINGLSTGLQSLNDCYCPGQVVSFECTIIGGELTSWEGSALMCQGREITLLHREFNTSTAMGECNSGETMISARSVRVTNNSYTSRLDVTLTPAVIGRDISCSSSDGIIDSTILRISTEPFQPPDVTMDVQPHEITFGWSSVDYNCENISYSISVMNCGTCITNITTSSTSCTGFLPPAMGNICIFGIQTVICGNIAGAIRTSTINLRVPAAPIVISVPRYLNGRTGRTQILIGLNTTFNMEDPFMITNNISGSPINYTISYTDSTFGTICGSEVIPASSCSGKVCNHYFDILESSSCPPSTVIVTVFATNVLGRGPSSVPVARDGLNNLVNVNFDATERSVICTFLNQPSQRIKECIANITYGSDCDQFLGVYEGVDTGDAVRTPSLGTVRGVAEYCFTVTAISNNVTVQVEGNLVNIGTGESGDNIASIVAPLIVVLVLLVLVILIIFIVLLVRWYRRKKSPTIVTIKFAIKDKPGSLAKALKVFKDRHINILGVNTHLHHANFSRIAAKGKKFNHVHCLCSDEDKEYLKSTFDARILEDDGQLQDQQSVSRGAADDQNRKYPITAVITVKDQPGGLWKILHEIGNRGINLLGVNTRSDRESSPGYKDNYVKCSCSELAIFNVVRDLEAIGALRIKVEVEIDIKRETNAVSYLVPDEVGALSRSLQVFSELGINISGVNPDHILDVQRITSHGFKQNYIECSIDDQKKIVLFEKLKKDYGAVQVELHPVPQEKQSISQNYRIVKVTNVDEKGALNRILGAFSELGINLHGVNILNPAFKREFTIIYKHYHLEITATDDQEIELKKKLQARSLAVDVKPFKSPIQSHTDDIDEKSSASNIGHSEMSDSAPVAKTIEFKVKNEAGSLMNALHVFSEVGVNITRVNPIHLSREHQDEYVECSCTKDKRAELVKTLQSHGAMKVKVLTKDEAPPREILDDPNYCVIKFSVGPKIGAIVEALESFKALGIRIIKVNPPHIKHQNQYAECYCNEEVQATLLSKLKAIHGVLHVGLPSKSEIPPGKPVDEPDYCVIKFSVGDEPGTLVRALKVFHELNINIIGVNTLNVAFERESKVNYKHNHVEYVATPDQESELKMRLQAAGLAVDVKPYTRIRKQHHTPSNGVREAQHFQLGDYEMEDLIEKEEK